MCLPAGRLPARRLTGSLPGSLHLACLPACLCLPVPSSAPAGRSVSHDRFIISSLTDVCGVMAADTLTFFVVPQLPSPYSQHPVYIRWAL